MYLCAASNHVRDDIKNHTEKENLGITAQYLIESCQSGAITCLVCISKIKRQNEVKFGKNKFESFIYSKKFVFF